MIIYALLDISNPYVDVKYEKGRFFQSEFYAVEYAKNILSEQIDDFEFHNVIVDQLGKCTYIRYRYDPGKIVLCFVVEPIYVR